MFKLQTTKFKAYCVMDPADHITVERRDSGLYAFQTTGGECIFLERHVAHALKQFLPDD